MSIERPLSAEAFWTELRASVFPLRPSQYDMTSICNLSCEGCLFFSGTDNEGHADIRGQHAAHAFFAGEAARGIRYGYFGGAEPSLAEGKLRAAAKHIPYGVVFTNGIKRISNAIPYRIHISVWGLPERSHALRGADIFAKQINNYRGDRRAVFVLTITPKNIDDLLPIAEMCAAEGVVLTFNHYSPTTKYIDFIEGRAAPDKYHSSASAADDLRLSADDLARSRSIISTVLERYPRTIIYTEDVNRRIHDADGLYPSLNADRVAEDCGVRLAGTLRHYNTDMVASDAKCCSPNIECSSCRLYAQSFATFLSRGTRRLRQADERSKLISLWRVWCALFLNHERLQTWRPAEALLTLEPHL